MNYWKFLLKTYSNEDWKRDYQETAISKLSGVPTPTIAKFEQKHTISLAAFVSMAKTLGYSKDIKELLSRPLYNTMEELETINRNKNRKRGRNEMDR